MMNVVEANDVEHWCATFLDELAGRVSISTPAEGEGWGREKPALAAATAGH